MSENGRKRCRKTKLVPRDCAEFNEDCFLQEPAQKKLLLHKIKKETDGNGENPDSSLEFSVKVEVEDINDSLPEEDPSDYMKYLFSLSKESQVKSEHARPRKSRDSLKGPTARPSVDSYSEDGEYEDKVFIMDANKMHKMFPILHRKCPNDKEAVTHTRNVWGKAFHEIGTCDLTLSIQDCELQDVLAEWKAWQLCSRTRESPFCYKCYICTDAWWSFSDFRNHIRIHPNSSVKLEIVHQECNVIAYDGGTPVYKDIFVDGKCFKCAKTFKQHQENKKYTDFYYYCVHCHDKFQTCTALVKHSGICDRNPIRTTAVIQDIMTNKQSFTEYPCKVCDAVFLSKPAQLEHLGVCHSVRSDEPISTGFKTCRLCSKSYYLFFYHVCTKRNIIHPCKHCGAKFQNRHMLNLHTKVSKWPVKCSICDEYIMKQCMAAEHYAMHSDNFQMLFRCLTCKKIRLFGSEEAVRQHRVKTHKRSDNRRPASDRIIIPKVMLEQCQFNPNARQKKIRVIVKQKPEVKSNEKVKAKRNSQNQRRNTVENNVTDEDVDIETNDPENYDHEESIDKDTFNIVNQITESIDIKPDIVVKEEKVTDDEDIKPDISKLLETETTTDEAQKETAAAEVGKTDSEIQKEPDIAEPVQASTPNKANAELSKVFQVSQSILEPVVIKTEIKVEPDDIDDDLIILNASSDSIKQESVDSEHSELSLLNLEPEVILKAGYRKRKVYKCNKCDYSGYHREYKEHINSHCMVVHRKGERSKKKEELNYQCTKCNKGYTCLKKYALHFVDHGYRYMTCPQCALVFDSLTRLMPHLNNHIKNQFMRLQLIQGNAEQGKAFQCKTCKEVVDMHNSFMHWENHLELTSELERDENIEDASVEARGAYVLEPDAMARILALLQQQDVADNGLPRKVKSCFVCHRTFERQNDCKRHLIEHLLDDAHAKLVDTQNLTCQICKECFNKVDTYKKHMRDHASLPIYQCSLCDKTFSDSSNFTKHKKIHNLKAFVCDICNKKFQAKLSLEKHVVMHMVTDPYTCQTCGRVFYDRSFYNRHVRQHHEKQRYRYKCVICRDKFDSLREKWDHMWEIHKQRKEKADCPICQKSYRKHIDVKRHCQTEHGVNTSLVNVLDFMRFKGEGDKGFCVRQEVVVNGCAPEVVNNCEQDTVESAPDSDNDVLLIEEERETLVIYDDEVPG